MAKPGTARSRPAAVVQALLPYAIILLVLLAWELLVRALDTGAPDLVVVPAAGLAALRREDWDVPEAVERLAGAVSVSRRADRAAQRVAAKAGR